MNYSKSQTKLSLFFLVFCFLYIGAYLTLFITSSQLYFGEAVSYEGLLRVLNGLKFASSPTEIPLSLTPYTPLFLTPLMALGKLFGHTKIEEVLIIARVFQSIALICLFFLLNRIRKTFFQDISSGLSFAWVTLAIFLFSPTLELALRPDTLSFFCEALSLFFVLKHLRYSLKKSLWIAALFSGFALALKANTIGGVAGTSIFFLLNKQSKSLFRYWLGLSLSVFVVLGLQYFFLGQALWTNIFQSVQSAILSGPAAVLVFQKLFDLFLIPLSYYFFLVILGLALVPQRKERLLLSLVLLFSFSFALMGQLKWGAFHNYFLGCLYLGLIPASLAFFKLCDFKRTALLIFHCFYLILFMVRGSSIPVKAWKEQSFFKELAQIRTLVGEKAPQGYLYTNEEMLQLAFNQRMAVGILSVELIETTPGLWKHIEPLKQNLSSIPSYSAYLFECTANKENITPRLFFDSSRLTQLTRVSTGKYCLYY